MRVLHFASIRWNSAIAEYALSAARSLKERGHATKLVGLEGAPLLRRASESGLEVTSLGSFAVTQILRAKSIIEDFKPDVIVTHGGPETILASLASAAKIPLFRVRGYAADTGFISGLTHDLGQLGVKGLIAPSRGIESSLEKISKIKTACIPLGIDTKRYVLSGDHRQSKRPTLVIFGRFDPVKGHREFMVLFKRLLDEWPPDEKPLLRIVGEPENVSTKHLEEFARESGLAWGYDVEVVAGRVADVPKFLSEATVGVVSSIGSEIICRVAQEFLSCGTPVFVTRVGSLPEVLVSPEMGLAFDYAEPQLAVEQMKAKLSAYRGESPEVRQVRASLAGREFSLEKMGEQLEVLFAESQ